MAPVDAGPRAGVRELALVRLSEEPGIAAELGLGRGDVAWAPDGARLALCRPDGTTVVREVATESERRVRGCHPRFGPDGTLFTDSVRPLSAELMRNGTVVLDAADFERGFEAGSSGPIDLLAFDVARDGLVAAAVSRQIPTGTKVVLELWRERSLEGAIALPSLFGNGGVRLGEFLRFAPNGRELAIGYSSGAGRITIVDLELERLLVEEIDLRAFAWSPDGAWLAVALEGELQVFGALRDVPAYVVPLDAAALDWSGQQEPVPAG